VEGGRGEEDYGGVDGEVVGVFYAMMSLGFRVYFRNCSVVWWYPFFCNPWASVFGWELGRGSCRFCFADIPECNLFRACRWSFDTFRIPKAKLRS